VGATAWHCGGVTAILASYRIGFLVFVPLFHRRRGIFPFWPWFRRDLLPRALAGVCEVAVSTGLLAAGPLIVHLPPPGWTHGAVAVLLFLTVFALFFLSLGDTQLLSRTLWQMTGGALARRRDTLSS